MIAGADEAGKGAYIGLGVLAIVLLEKKTLDELDKLYNIKDSKLCSKKKILFIYHKLKNFVQHDFVYLTPKEIDCTNLNTLLELKYIELIKKHSFEYVIIDCPVLDPLKFSDKLRLATGKVVLASHKADLIHKVVGLASIFAKAKRELHIQQLKLNFNIDFGSGYPSDPKTKIVAKNIIYKNVLKDHIRNKWNISV
jgi:ribonuclease HII